METKAEEEKIKAAIEDWEKMSATGETDSILYYWSDDAIVMGPGQPMIQGKEAIRTMVEGTKKIPGFKMTWGKPISINVANSGDLAYVIIKNHLTINDSIGRPITQDNKALAIWKKQKDNSWREAVIIFNADPLQK
jgi:uncharacterized protein (TIGR02246 family)